ncbi:MAG: hypothetical protein LBL99_00015 [Holosporaceae bacterium]|jgi:glucose-6-phosphate isomerase|nr:hypothetical protein [Holosporaceae bacterium]
MKDRLFSQSILFPKELSKPRFDFINDLTKLDCFSIVKTTDDLKIFENSRLKKWMTANKNFIVFGTGGSSLCGQCAQAISASKNVKFVANLDPTTLKKVFSEINPTETGFLCISKSGETLETICQTLLALDFVEKKDDKFVVITEDKPSSLKEIAQKFNFLCLDHPKTIGGRFSAFSIVGALPAALCGVDPFAMRTGGKKVLENFLEEVKNGASFVFESYKNKLPQHVSFIYSDKLATFGAWLAQLYAESSGKDGAGVTPLTAIGSVDQHSQLQLYLDGAKDKCFTFFFEKQESGLTLNDNFPSKFLYLKNKEITDVFKAQCDATIAALLEKGNYVRKIETPPVTPEVLGALFMHFTLEVACVCKAIGVDPFDQPAVERGKILTKELLSAC